MHYSYGNSGGSVVDKADIGNWEGQVHIRGMWIRGKKVTDEIGSARQLSRVVESDRARRGGEWTIYS